MATYQLLPNTGKHWQDGKYYYAGEYVESYSPLDKQFKNKFVKVHAPPKPAKKKKKKKKKKVSVKKKAAVKTAPGKGTDVTENFEIAANMDGLISVFKRGAYHHVYEKDSDTPLNEKGLKAEKVEEFLKDWLES